MPNSTKVNEFLKEQSLELNGIENQYLIGEKFEEKISKIPTAEQKPRTIFNRLQKSSTSAFSPSHQLFPLGPLSQNNQPGAPGGNGREGSWFERATFRNS